MNTNQEMYWYGLDGPCVIGTLKIINSSGTISPEQNIEHAKILVKHISDNLKLPDKKYKNNTIILFNRIMYKRIYFVPAYQYRLSNKTRQMLQFLILLYQTF